MMRVFLEMYIRVFRNCFLLIALALIALAAPPSSLVACQEVVEEPATRHLIVVRGIDGTAEFGAMFQQWTAEWMKAGQQAGFRLTSIDGADNESAINESADDPNGTVSSLQHLEKTLQAAGNSVDELWLVFIGHGTFDGESAKFNLTGDDVSASQLRKWLQPRTKPTVIVNCASCSAPFVEALTGKNRIVVTSTKSGYEMSFARFGEYLAEAIGSTDIDLDKDQQTSLLEAVIVANRKTAEFYDADSRLPSEHAMIEDNSDGRGTPVDWFRGVRVTKKAKDGTPSDGLRANQVFFSRRGVDALLSAESIAKRNQLEEQIAELRSRRSRLTEDQYYQQLETLMVSLAKLYTQQSEDQ